MSALPRNIMEQKIVPSKAKSPSNVQQMATLAQVSRQFRNMYAPYLKKYRIEKEFSNYLKGLRYSMIARQPRENRPIVNKGNKPWHVSRKLVLAQSPYVNQRTRNMAKRVNERNVILKRIKNSLKRNVNRSTPGMITFTTVPNNKRYTYFTGYKNLHGMNAGIPKGGISRKSIGV
jgi:hypothetical protein